MSNYKDPSLQIAVSQSNGSNSFGAKVEEYTSFGVQVMTPRRESLCRTITCAGPFLMNNLSISHHLLNWISSQGTQIQLKQKGSSCCSTNQTAFGKGISQKRERKGIVAAPQSPSIRAQRVVFLVAGICQPRYTAQHVWVQCDTCGFLMHLRPAYLSCTYYFPSTCYNDAVYF